MSAARQDRKPSARARAVVQMNGGAAPSEICARALAGLIACDSELQAGQALCEAVGATVPCDGAWVLCTEFDPRNPYVFCGAPMDRISLPDAKAASALAASRAAAVEGNYGVAIPIPMEGGVPTGALFIGTRQGLSPEVSAALAELCAALGRRILEFRAADDRRGSEAALLRSNSLLESLTWAQRQYLSNREATPAFRGLLDVLIEVTESDLGFVAKALDDGSYKTLALVDVSGAHTKEGADGCDVIRGVLERARGAQAPLWQDGGSLPPFLAMPLRRGAEPLGFLVVAGRARGYSRADAQFLEPIHAACAQILEGERDKRRRHEAERKLDAHARRFQALIEYGSDIVTLVDRKGIVVYQSPSVGPVLGYGPEEMLGRRVLEFVFPEDRLKVARRFRRQAGGECRIDPFECRFCHKSGAWLTLESTANDKLDDPDVHAFIVNSRDITERKRVSEMLARQLDGFAALRDIDLSLSATLEPNQTKEMLIQGLATALGAHAVLLYSQNGLGQLMLEKSPSGAAPSRSMKRLTPGRRDLLAKALRNGVASGDCSGSGALGKAGYRWLVAARLSMGNESPGLVMAAYRRKPEHAEDAIRLMAMIVAHASLAIDKAVLFASLQQSNSDLIASYDATIEGWVRALDLRDKETEGHTQRVTDLTVRFARAEGIPEEEIESVRRGSLLHDIGKIGIPDGILQKPGALTPEERRIIETHAELAFRMLEPIGFLRDALAIPYSHHEKWDGSGYPQGLAGEQIPLSARMFALADVWDALRSDRPYRAGWMKERVADHIRAESGRHFDPALVEPFLELVASEG